MGTTQICCTRDSGYLISQPLHSSLFVLKLDSAFTIHKWVTCLDIVLIH
jgi:hypothetical protein